MSILKVANIGHPALRGRAREVSEQELASEGFQRLADDLIETMREYGGVGIAAPQVREPMRAFAVEVRPNEGPTGRTAFPLHVIVNPVVRALTEEPASEWEGCLSIPGLRGRVVRPRAIRVEGLTRAGDPLVLELEGFAAVVCQHETDHLDGIVYLDRMPDLRELMAEDEYQRRIAQPLLMSGGDDG